MATKGHTYLNKAETCRTISLNAPSYMFNGTLNKPLISITSLRSSHRGSSIKKGVLKIFFKIHRKTPVSESLFLIKLQPQACNFTKRATPAEFCKTFQNAFLQRTPPVVASDHVLVPSITIINYFYRL